MSRLVRAFGVLAIPVLAVPVVAAGASAATAPKPPTKSLPSALDVASPYQAQRLCDPNAKPGVVAFAKLMSSHYKLGTASWGITRNCNSGLTEHSEGRAWDWMLSVNKPNEKVVADAVTRWLSAPDAQGRPGAMARRFGIMYIIWNHKMWRAYDPGRGWATYTGPVPHTDHVHFSFSWDGAYGRTSWWTGKALTRSTRAPPRHPSPPPRRRPRRRSTPCSSRAPQDLTSRWRRGSSASTPDGVFGPEDGGRAARLAGGARRQGDRRQLDPATWAKMVALKLIPPRGTSLHAPTGRRHRPRSPAPTTPARGYAS